MTAKNLTRSCNARIACTANFVASDVKSATSLQEQKISFSAPSVMPPTSALAATSMMLPFSGVTLARSTFVAKRDVKKLGGATFVTTSNAQVASLRSRVDCAAKTIGTGSVRLRLGLFSLVLSANKHFAVIAKIASIVRVVRNRTVVIVVGIGAVTPVASLSMCRLANTYITRQLFAATDGFQAPAA